MYDGVNAHRFVPSPMQEAPSVMDVENDDAIKLSNGSGVTLLLPDIRRERARCEAVLQKATRPLRQKLRGLAREDRGDLTPTPRRAEVSLRNIKLYGDEKCLAEIYEKTRKKLVEAGRIDCSQVKEKSEENRIPELSSVQRVLLAVCVAFGFRCNRKSLQEMLTSDVFYDNLLNLSEDVVWKDVGKRVLQEKQTKNHLLNALNKLDRLEVRGAPLSERFHLLLIQIFTEDAEKGSTNTVTV